MRLLFDTDIILDIALMRPPHYIGSATAFRKVDNKQVYGFVTITTITDIFYLAKKEKGHQIAIGFISNLIQIMGVIGIDKEIILDSLSSNFTDFKTAVQSAPLSFNNIDFIITRKAEDYKDSEIKAISPNDFLNLMKRKKQSKKN